MASTTTSTTESAVSVENFSLLSERGRKALEALIAFDEENNKAQSHVYQDWPEPGVEDEGKKQLAEQLADLNESYPGGLASYLSKARVLLKESAEGLNPFADFEASVPVGESLSYHEECDTKDENCMTFSEAEEIGRKGAAHLAFVLVAGGLGERLGYSGIKLSLETNLCTNNCYLEFYAQYIRALEEDSSTEDESVTIPLVIMTSGDTDAATRQLLADNDNFGLKDVQIVCQDKVPALMNSEAGLSMKSRWEVETKPHGHGDVHHLLFREGHVDKWEKAGRRHVVFLQDTNALVVNSILPTLGVSIAKGFHMNSICIPRLAGEAAGAIARLDHKTDPEKSLVINVEYNQLDPLLKSQGSSDEPDPSTGYSPFPGNANNLVLEMGAYAKTLRGEDQGVVVEFVNPKYKPDSIEFKKPTRLECMMQDLPKLFQKEMGQDVNIGFTMFDRWFTFSPAKNSLESGVEACAAGGSAPGTMSSAESDKYIQNQQKLLFSGMDVGVSTADDLVPVGGIPVTPGPRIILSPSFALTQACLNEKIVSGKSSITTKSSLVLDGTGINVESLDLDGALVVKAAPGVKVTLKDLVVKNKGWTLEELEGEEPEHVAIRGYTMNKEETLEISLTEPGEYVVEGDGKVTKL